MKVKDIITKERKLTYQCEITQNKYSDYLENDYSKELKENKKDAINKAEQIKNEWEALEEQLKDFLNQDIVLL